MKKVFFAAAFAVVAVAGAFATNSKMANQYYSTSSNELDIDCTGLDSSCEVFLGIAHDKPANDPSRVPISLAQLETEFYNP